MAGIEDFVEIFRGENVRLNPFRERSSSSRDSKDLWKAGKFITDKAGEAASYARKFPAIIKSAKVPKSTWTAAKTLFDKTHFVQPTTSRQAYGLLNHADKNKLKVNILKTIGVNLKNLSPLAVQGLNVLTSLPVATIAMVLKSTPANADEATMKLEDFAKLAEEAQPKEKEMMAAGGNVPSTDIKDYYRRAWGLGDRVPFKYGGTWADWMTNFSDQMTFEEYLRMDLKEKKLHILDRKAEGGRIGQLVQPNVDGSRPGYSGDYTEAEKLKQNRIYTIHEGKRTLDLTTEQKRWFNKTHKNNPESRFYKKEWHDLGGKKADLLDSYYNQLNMPKPPKNYITTKEFSKKYNFPIYEKSGLKAESSFIGNALKKTLTSGDLERGRKNLLTKKFLTETLQPKSFQVLKDLGDGKKTVHKTWYVKDSPILAKKVKVYLESPYVRPETRANMTKILKNQKIADLFKIGDYKGLVEALKDVKGLTNAQRANALLRIAQAMEGVTFRDFDHGLRLNKISANKIFAGLEKAKWGNPYGDAYKKLKYTTIKDAIGEGYFTKSYRGFLDDAKLALNKAGINTKALNLDLNEITGLTSAYKNKTFSSSQFINFMDSNFNSQAHASMIKEYGAQEKKLQKIIKDKKPGWTKNAKKLITDWESWRNAWYNRLDDKFKTKAIRDILPTFKLGKDPYSQVISKKRLNELAKLNFHIRDEGIKSGYAKTFKNISDQPIVKEIALSEEKALNKIKDQLKNHLEKNPQIKNNLLNKVNSGIPVDDITRMIAQDLKVPAQAVGRVLGKVLKVLGPVGWAAEPVFAAINFSEAIDEGLSGKQAGAYTLGKAAEDIWNLPGMVIGGIDYGIKKLKGEGKKAGPFEYLPTKPEYEAPYEATFARDYKTRTADAIPENVKLRRKFDREFDNTIGWNMTMVDYTDMPASRNEVAMARDTFLKEKLGENYQVTHPKDVEKEKLEIKETDNIFGTEVPTKNLTGVDIYKFNRGI